MKIKNYACILLSLALLTACSIGAGSTEPTAIPIDIGAIQTAAVATVVAGVTQTAAAFTATPAPTEVLTQTPTLPSITETSTATSSPTPGGTPTAIICDRLEFVSDLTVPDNTTMSAGQEFVKTWKVKNTGSCTWATTYHLILSYGEPMGGQPTFLTAEVLPNTEAEISVTLKAPIKPGTYGGYWILANNNNVNFESRLSVVIVVPSP